MHKARHNALRSGFQTLLDRIYPHECLSCREALADASGLCGPCWRDTPFLLGGGCALCGAPLLGEVQPGDICDACQSARRPWVQGAAALAYEGRARALVMGLKYGDRHDIARPAARWMLAAMGGTLDPEVLIVPVPLHWTRQIRRRYNQAALLGQALARMTGCEMRVDLLRRTRATRVLDGVGQKERIAELRGAIAAVPGRASVLKGRSLLLVDDVMTSGATLSACARACLEAGVSEVRVAVLARAVRRG